MYLDFSCIIRKRNLLAHVSIWTIAAIVLIISTTVFRGNLFGIIYLLLFLIFVLTFQTFHSLWARCIKSYCLTLMIYSTGVSLLTYLYQYTGINALFKQILSDQMLNDIGLVARTQAWMIFLEPFAPLALTLLIFIYLKVFHDNFDRFAYLAEEDDTSLSTPLTESQMNIHHTINDSTFIPLNTNVTNRGGNHNNQQDNEQSRAISITNQATNNLTASKIDLRRASKRAKFENFINAASECCWRLLETHFIKLVAFMIFRLPIIDLCLLNFPFLFVVICILKYPSAARCTTLISSWLISFIIITRQVSNLTTLRTIDFTSTCGANSPTALVGNTYSYLTYLGINHDTDSPLNRVDSHIYVLLLITIYSFISIHYKRRSVKNYELSFGVIFTGIGRREADISIINCFKYFFNFGFYKFGVEITCLAMIIGISNRLDSVGAIYGLILTIISITTSKKTLSSIWPILNIIVSLLIPLQYALRLGLPPALCIAYPWDSMLPDFKYWLYLSDYSAPQDVQLLYYDFLIFLVICRQAVAFKHMSISSGPSFVINNQMHHNFSAYQFKMRYLPSEDEFAAEDCFSNYSTPSNYMKSIFFISIYWITLAVVLVAGATKISLFSLGYLIGCFIFLWLGNDTYLMPLKRLIFSWNWFIFYATLVIFSKVILQLYTCYVHEYLLEHCYILQLLRVVCYRKIQTPPPITSQAGLCAASLPYDELDILWDGLCLMFLLMQRIVFGSQYFRYLVLEVKAQQILASRGAELIMATQAEEAKAQALYEREVMSNIRTKMEDLRTDNEETSKAWKRLLCLPHHHQVIRNADRHLFSQLHDDAVSQYRTADWRFKKAFIPDPLGDELERMSDINGITAVFTRWMKGKPLYGNGYSSHSTSSPPSPHNGGLDVGCDNNGDNNAGDTGHPRGGPTREGTPEQADVSLAEPIEVLEQEEQPEHQEELATGSFDVISEADSGENDRVRGCWDMFTLIVYSCLLSATVELNKLSRSYRYVSRRMAVEKNALKKHFNLNDERFKKDPNWRKWVISTLSDSYTRTNEQYQEGQSNTSLHRIRSALKVITSTGSSQDSAHSGDSDQKSPPTTSYKTSSKGAELTDPEYHFLKLNIFTQFCRALAYVFISNTSLLCQLVIILNQVLTASLLSLPLPLLTFLWGTLSVPRPTKRFWKTVITYTELVIVIKYVFQFPIWDWDTNNINPFYYPNLLGIKDITIIYDLFLLLALFFHRSMLKSLGQWDVSVHQGSGFINSGDQSQPPIEEQPSTSKQADSSGKRPGSKHDDGDQEEGGLRMIKSLEVAPGGQPVELASRLASSVDLSRDNYPLDSYQHQVEEIKIDESLVEDPKKKRNCFVRAYHRTRRSIALFFRHVLDTPYKVQTDVYVWMFLCDFINFLVLIYGFWAFGSGYTNQTVASFLNENRIPFSVLIMLLAQFASIIIDRAFYLQKNIAGKLTFQVILIVGIHVWLFFALPFTTGHTLTLKQYWPPKAFYVFKCIYFLLSAHQIRSGYPRRVLGNCFTKGFGYSNWGIFKVYRAIPLVYDLRLYMDWIWTETTLEFRNWSLMEDMFANLFIRKCELTLEEEYPTPRAKPIKHLSKYLTGGAYILLILAIIWGPLLLFSMGKTVGESNPPVEMEYELEFIGFQPILRMRATVQQIEMIDNAQYDQLKMKFVSLSSQSFLGDYKLGDVAAIRLDGQSNAVWEISPPSKELLMSRIKNNDTITLKSSWTVFRIKKAKSQSFDVSIAGSYQNIITNNSSQEFRQQLYDMLDNSATTLTPPSETKFVITPPIFPNYIRVPETGQAALVEQFADNLFQYEPLRPLNLSYIRMFDLNVNQTDNSTSWWKADDLCKYHPINDSYPFWSGTTAGQLEHCDSLVVIAFNDRIFTGLLALLSAPGIIGLYTTFVVFFARLIRTEPSGKVIYTEIPNVDRVYGLIMDIYMMRECGEFELEEKLFSKLLFLYRSPEMLIEFSKREDELQAELESPR